MGFLDFLFGKKAEKKDTVLEEDKVLEPKKKVVVGPAPTEENKIKAIKAIREHAGLDLKTAKLISETLPQTLEVQGAERFGQTMRKLGYPVKGDFDEMSAEDFVHTGWGRICLQVEETESGGDQIGAIKAVRFYTGCDLRTARDFMENLPKTLEVNDDWGFIEEMNRCGYTVNRIRLSEQNTGGKTCS